MYFYKLQQSLLIYKYQNLKFQTSLLGPKILLLLFSNLPLRK